MESVKRQVPIAERKSYLALVTYQILLFAIYLMQLSRMTSLFISLQTSMSIAIQTSQYHDQSNEVFLILPDARFLCVPCFFLNFTKALFFASALTCRQIFLYPSLDSPASKRTELLSFACAGTMCFPCVGFEISLYRIPLEIGHDYMW